jgi:NAD+ synthase (glutamine-hydrolysing)
VILRVALAQINPTVGDFTGNARKIVESIESAKRAGADLVAFPEQSIPGYPAEDLLQKPQFLAANAKTLEQVAKAAEGICAVIGFAEKADKVYNSAAVCLDGKIAAVYRKHHLPNYAVFDEVRYFAAGNSPMVLDLGGAKIGISVCEDIWVPGTPETDEVLAGGAQCVLNISASPYHAGKAKSRADMLAGRAKDLATWILFVNTVGGQDELVFDGNSAVFDPFGITYARAKALEEDLLVCDIDLDAAVAAQKQNPTDQKPTGAIVDTVELKRPVDPTLRALLTPHLEPDLDATAEIYKALELGVSDYVRKNGFTKVVLGLSGGVDSALTAAIAADALGPENVVTLFLPSRYSSVDSREDAEALAANFGISISDVPIGKAYDAFESTLAPHFAGRESDLTEENIQARIRGVLLMAFSNKFGYMLLSTGNKSENSVGYATLYGDMAGGFNIIKDCSKELVYALCRYRNDLAGTALIPERILTKAPTAELRDNQKDSDSLPEYEILDPILEMYVEQDRSFAEIVAEGFDPDTVSRIIRLVDKAEYKRRQSCPGIKITPRAFGKDRRLPITNRYEDGKD